MNNKKVTVIMSVFNNESTLENSIKSILKQSYENLEFLITDDYSADKSLNILYKYKDEDSRVKIISNKENIGLTKSLNNMIRIADGDYIARQDADDISLSHRLETQVKTLNFSNAKICTSRALKMDTKTKIPGFSFYIPYKYSIFFKNPFIHGTLLIDSLLMKNYLYDESYYFAQDYELFSRIIKNNENIININEALYILNTKNNISKNFKDEQKSYANIVKNNLRKF